jgi:hypothetical protein
LYSEKVTQQLHGVEDKQSAKIQPINLSFAGMKHLTATWLVGMAAYISDNPQFVVNGFRHSGILAALDDNSDDEETDIEDFTDDADMISDEDYEDMEPLALPENFFTLPVSDDDD